MLPWKVDVDKGVVTHNPTGLVVEFKPGDGGFEGRPINPEVLDLKKIGGAKGAAQLMREAGDAWNEQQLIID